MINLFYKNQIILDKYSFFTSFDYQTEVLSYLHPYSPYKVLTLFLSVGSGKTYSSASLSHLYLMEGFNVLYLSNSINSITNFIDVYKDVVLRNRFDSYVKYIHAMTYSKYYYSTDNTEYDLIILDEVHNLKSSGLRYKSLKSKLNKFTNSKLLVLTATPVVDDIKEIDTILNISGTTSKVLYSHVKEFKNIKVNYIGEKYKDYTLFYSDLKGIQLENYNKVYNSDKNSIYAKSRQSAITTNNKFNSDIPLEEQSSKIYKLTTVLTTRPTIVFCPFIKRGINFLVDVLKFLGYEDYKSNSDARKYAVISGITSKEEVSNIIFNYNNILNVNGDIINILIGSTVLNESVSLFNTKVVHILSPHWNFSQFKQSIGRAIRIGSHDFLAPEDKFIDIYIHVARNTIDQYVFDVAHKKEKEIEERLLECKLNNKYVSDFISMALPEPDNVLIFKYFDKIYDFSECFDKNAYKISWGNFYSQNIIVYDLKNNLMVKGDIPVFIKINLPLTDGYSIWKSCIDFKYRISCIHSVKNKKSFRGKLLNNLSKKEIIKISDELKCDSKLSSIIKYMKDNNRFIKKQIEIISI